MSGVIKQKVYDTVVNSYQRLTPIEVEKKVAAEMRAGRKLIKTAIRELVDEGVLRYTEVGGCFLERSFDRPVRVSRRIVVKPPHKMYAPEKEDIVIDITSGIAFGDGAHPSTSLILKTLDEMFSDGNNKGISLSRALDVGTGTGILAIAAARLGFREVIGIDIDNVAVFEAQNNVRINNLAGQIIISTNPLEEIASSFPLVMANISFQTLEKLCPLLVERVEEGGMLVLSGFTIDKGEGLLQRYVRSGLTLIQREEERSWECFVLGKRFVR